ncbi:MAG: hypothetical protein P8M22_12385 [Phycisphaerales bacterium]|nr:hypothetical protein [Phycisphaerales bacterium]
MSQQPRRRQTAHSLMLFILSNWARTVVLVVVGFILTPLMIEAFGLVLFGLLILVQQITISMVRPVRAAVTSTLVKSISEARGSGEENGFSSVFTNGVGLMTMLFTALVVLGILAIFFAKNILDFPAEQVSNVQLAIAGEVIIISMSSFTAPWLALFLLDQRPILYNADLAIRRWLDMIAFLLALMPFGLEIFQRFIIIRTSLCMMHFLVRVLVARRVMVEARVKPSLLNWSRMGQLLRLGGLTTGQPFSNFNFFVLDNYLFNIVFGPIYNGLYAIVTQLRGYARRFGSQVFDGMVAIAADIHERGEKQTNIRAMLAVSRITAGVMMLSTGIIIIFFRPLIDLWLGSRLRMDETLLSVLSYESAIDLIWGILAMLLVGGIMLETATAASKFLYGMGLVKRYAGVLFTSGITKFVVSVLVVVLIINFIPDLETRPDVPLIFPGITLICQIIFFGIVMPHRVTRLTGISVATWCWHAIIKPLMSAVIPLGVGVILILTIQEWNWAWLVSSILLVGLLCMPSSFFLLFEADERKRIWHVIGRVRSRR